MHINFFEILFLNNWRIWLIIIAVLLLKIIYQIFKPAIKGFFGETVFNIVSSTHFGRDWHILKNIVIPAYDGTTQIDQIAISKFGIFVIEIKTYKGWIFGNEKNAKWTQSIYKSRHTFQNPLFQNYKHIKSLIELTKLSESKFKSVIIFSGEVEFKTPMPRNVFKGSAYIDYIKSFKEVQLSDSEIGHFLKSIAENKLTSSDHKDYIKKRKTGNLQQHSSNAPSIPSNVSSAEVNASGFCLRCKKRIQHNPQRPYCFNCYRIWSKYKNRNYKESYCHSCGKEFSSTIIKPECYSCYQKSRRQLVH